MLVARRCPSLSGLVLGSDYDGCVRNGARVTLKSRDFLIIFWEWVEGMGWVRVEGVGGGGGGGLGGGGGGGCCTALQISLQSCPYPANTSNAHYSVVL